MRQINISGKCLIPYLTKHRVKLVFIHAFFLAVHSYSQAETPVDEVIPKNDRLFSIAITPPKVTDISQFWPSYVSALNLAIETGIDLPGELPFTWSVNEKKSLFGKISYRDENSRKLIALLKEKKFPVVITIQVFETLESRIPSDLRHLPYSHPKTMHRLKNYIRWIYQETQGLEVIAVVFGNEFDLHLNLEEANGRNRWQELEQMIVETKTYIKSLPGWQSTPFSLEATYGGLTGISKDVMQQLNTHADIIGVSYYPMNEKNVKAPNALVEDINTLIDIYPNKTIDFYQYGYPSSSKINSSLEKQRQFIEETFKYWDKHQTKIRLITFTWLYDVQKIHIEKMRKNTLGDLTPGEAFVEFIGSLGLHGELEGDEKPAFKELRQQVRLRQW